MSEAENTNVVRFKSFAEKVWTTFQLIDISPYIETKRIGKELEYLSWANAWRCVMGCFPESTFYFEELSKFDNGTCEQWVVVTIKEGEAETSRRWWLPVLDHRNQPVIDPNAMQINNTRMRVLVKCLAMMGLGTELYAGEDVPDPENDKDAVSGVKGGETLPPAMLFEGRGHIETINDALPVESIVTDSAGRIKDLHKDMIDFEAIDQLLTEFHGKQELQLWVYDNIHKLQNRTLRNYEKKKLKEAQE